MNPYTRLLDEVAHLPRRKLEELDEFLHALLGHCHEGFYYLSYG